ncbi:hypothetical protein ACH427_22635 [Streptomyces sp. NPDC020379]|uniref:hypothetical protein n=1 Tax=Streptomyces sp. NPDC020379 TaxID=3365071 RepID=UPI0037A1DE15
MPRPLSPAYAAAPTVSPPLSPTAGSIHHPTDWSRTMGGENEVNGYDVFEEEIVTPTPQPEEGDGDDD